MVAAESMAIDSRGPDDTATTGIMIDSATPTISSTSTQNRSNLPIVSPCDGKLVFYINLLLFVKKLAKLAFCVKKIFNMEILKSGVMATELEMIGATTLKKLIND